MREKVLAVGQKKGSARGMRPPPPPGLCGAGTGEGAGGERGPARRVRRVALWLTAAASRSERERLAAHYHNPALSLRDVIQSRERR